MAVVAANGIVTWFGQVALPFTAFVLIPFDLVARDALHDRWAGRWLWPRMFGLVAGGSLVSWLSATGSPAVCVASAVSFAAAGVTDALSYQLLNNRPRFIRMNGSNAMSAVVDSIAFPLLAFGGVSVGLSVSQSASKFAGGFIWAWFFTRSGEE